MSTECSEFEWSDNPGAYESHLIRRCNNPYFPTHLQAVSEQELLEARSIDNSDYLLAKERFVQLTKPIEALASGAKVAEFHKVRECIEDLIHFCMGVGGRAYELAEKYDHVRNALVLDLRDAFSEDQNALKTIEKADESHGQTRRKFYIPIIAQILRERSPIKGEGFVPAILSEEPETIAAVLSVLSKGERQPIETEALMIMKKALDQGYIDNHFVEKISVLTDRRE
ncbi:MAG: hypothetical protein K8F52_13465 [Candidatus Scalindua rubra]|uniref:Uncharacterized protein n=1 Tax=Candidatus Scalindua brodae TaxID=237368 RepID=A0A0B0ETT1_9BACT|nr:MAG: hypothetical protein SCABRO_00158 [Candidatus Scalindua brodae]MBZ0109668.1 hypothetical protein [Candidatus Scalindua rubra]